MTTRHLTVAELRRLADGMPVQCAIVDPGALVGAAARHAATGGGLHMYPTLQAKAAALMHSLVQTSPFQQCYRGFAWTAASHFLQNNGGNLPDYTPTEIRDMFQRVQSGDAMLWDLASWLEVPLGR